MKYVYLLKLSNGDLYKGITSDLKSRITAHKQGKVASTRHKLPFILIGYEAYRCDSDAERRERFLKTSDGRTMIKRQFRDALTV